MEFAAHCKNTVLHKTGLERYYIADCSHIVGCYHIVDCSLDTDYIVDHRVGYIAGCIVDHRVGCIAGYIVDCIVGNIAPGI